MYLALCPLIVNACTVEINLDEINKTRTYTFTVDGQTVHYKYYNVVPSFSSLHNSAYSFDKETFQGGAIINNTLFLTRHNGVVDLININEGNLCYKEEFIIPYLKEVQAHLNTASFSSYYPVNNLKYPFLYVDRCSYYSQKPDISDAERNCCYVLNICEDSAIVVQTILFCNDEHQYFDGKYGGAQCWCVDRFRDKLMCIGYSMQGDERVFLIKEFKLPNVSDLTVELHDRDVIKQWSVSDRYNGIQHAFQAMTITMDYIMIPISRGDSGYESEAIKVISTESNKELFVIELVEKEVGEVQNIQEYNGDYFVISKNGRIDKLERKHDAS